MNSTQLPPQPPPSAPEDRAQRTGGRLYRSPQGQRSVGGVARGLADYLGVSAGWVRFAFVVLTFVGGLGLIAYLAAWVLVPERPAGLVPERGDHNLRFDSAPAFFGALLILIAVSILFNEFAFWSGSVFWAVVFIVAGVALFQRADRSPRPSAPSRDQSVPLPPPNPLSTGSGISAVPGGSGTATAQPAAGQAPSSTLPPPSVTPPTGPGYRGPGGTSPLTPPQTWQPKPARPRERSVLGRITIAAAFVIVGVLIGLDQTGLWAVSWVQIGAAALATVGAGLLVGTFFGRARWLIVIAAMLTAPLVAVATFDLPLDASSGVRTASPATVEALPAAYELGVGELDIDLTDLDLAGRTVELNTSVGLGELTITVPDDMGLELTSRVGLGEIRTPDRNTEGFGLERAFEQEPGPGAGTLVIDAQAGLGAIIVDTVTAEEQTS